MTQAYDEAGNFVPVTVLEVGPCPIVRRMEGETGGGWLQIAYEKVSEKKISKAEIGHLKTYGIDPHRHLMQLKVADLGLYAEDKEFNATNFAAGEKVDVSGTVKGRGTQGVVKRYGFSGGPASHGSMFHRRGGSYGCREEPGRVYKGRKMPGHMGNVKRTAQNLSVVRVISEKNLILVKGSVAGATGSLLIVRSAIKG